jgi:hypothetical protein
VAFYVYEWRNPDGSGVFRSFRADEHQFGRAPDSVIPVPAQPPKQEPVAMRYGWDGHGYQYIDNGSGSDWRERHKDGEPLYAAPPKPAQDLIVGYAENHDIDRAGHDFWVSRQPGKNTVPLYLYGHPPKIWQGLTDEEIAEAAKRFRWDDKYAFESAACWAEEMLKDKNRG